MDAKKTAHGTCKVRLRVGSSARVTFEVNTPNETVADARGLRMQVVAAACVRAGMKLDERQLLLRSMASEALESDFAKCERRALLEAQAVANAPAAEPRKLASTFGELWQMWVSGELTALYPVKVPPIDSETAKKARQRLGVMQKTIGPVALRDFTEAMADAAIAALPRDMASSTRGQHQALIRRVLNIAVEIDLIAVNPLKKKWCGSVKSTRSKSFLYPSDDLRLVSCQAVEFAYRLLWGFLAREGCRLDEALDLFWSHVDLARGSVRIDKHKSRRKTGKSRVWVMEPGTVAALKWWYFDLQRQHLAPPAGRVFAGLEGLNDKNAAQLLREVHCRAAGMEDRPELFEHNAERRQFCAHMLRDTFVTLALANKRTEHEIMSKTGHANSDQLHEYGAGADLARVMGFTGFLAPLDEALGLTTGSAANDGAPPVNSTALGDDQALPRTGTAAAARVATRVATDSRTGMFSAGHRGLPQTPDSCSGEHGAPDSADLDAAACSDEHAGPPRLGGVATEGVATGVKPEPVSPALDVGQIPDAETALANAAAGAVAAGQWGLAKTFASLLEERQRSRLAPGVSSLDAARARKAGG